MVSALAIALATCAASLPIARCRPPIEVYLYRAMTGSHVGLYTLENNNLASLVGVLKYIHTEVIAEHTISPPDRLTRKYSIDVIATSKFAVKNPSSLLSPENSFVQYVDFGPFVTFDIGVATNSIQLEYIKRFGSFVGVQDQRDVRFAYDDPYYWFSVNGFCPNLQWADKGTKQSPNPSCLRDGKGRTVEGGLCTGSGTRDQPPTGSPNCTYTYGNESVVVLDEVAGLLEEDCGGRRCTSWADFRRNCSNTAYRTWFDRGTGKAAPFPYCVEYDIHPACEADCAAPACLALPEEQRELGVPFWRGRCSPERNVRRAQRLSLAFGIDGADRRHKLASAPAPAEAERCMYPGGMCRPSPEAGGMYCSRSWAGVCQPCWIPGTKRKYPAEDQPLCPYNVLESVDYRDASQFAPKCKSKRPRDLCCLYMSPSTCHPSLSSEVLPVDNDGYALAVAKQNTTVMTAFLSRVAIERLGCRVIDPAGLAEMAYWEWGPSPKKSRTLEAVEVAMASYLACPKRAAGRTLAATTVSLASVHHDVPEHESVDASSISASRNGLLSLACSLSVASILARA
eukprot:CAMPEP_0179080472 /NCGR_PEP_ID=MMETSP0796-20121207/36169_1 /TAXON_ID=73915 /ORGANISM="Pyrodinium bahamense, Strain pbaha01" /LENGTH=567 /DNA_ID=CAMNT_0020777827 /DNA_START=307 /DNA_END=2010 /DNA_ORIENTATION=-